jgi:hypothetical protein
MLLVFSRFGLAVPALVLDDRSVSQAMFRSDELTEGKWLILAILLVKSLIGGYVAGMIPFWLPRWAWPYIQRYQAQPFASRDIAARWNAHSDDTF